MSGYNYRGGPLSWRGLPPPGARAGDAAALGAAGGICGAGCWPEKNGCYCDYATPGAGMARKINMVSRRTSRRSLGSLGGTSLGNSMPGWAPAVRAGAPESLTGDPLTATTGSKLVLLGGAAALALYLWRKNKKRR